MADRSNGIYSAAAGEEAGLLWGERCLGLCIAMLAAKARNCLKELLTISFKLGIPHPCNLEHFLF